jgi:hypothetical protein
MLVSTEPEAPEPESEPVPTYGHEIKRSLAR